MLEAASSLPTNLLKLGGELEYSARSGFRQDKLEGLPPLLQGRPSTALERRELDSVSSGKRKETSFGS